MPERELIAKAESAARIGGLNIQPVEAPTTPLKGIYFAFASNGYFPQPDGFFRYSRASVEPFTREFRAQRVSFFGPQPNDAFYIGDSVMSTTFLDALKQPEVAALMGKYYQYDPDQAARMGFILGGMIRQFSASHSHNEKTQDQINRNVSFVSGMALVGNEKSGDAIVSALALYVHSGGSVDDNNKFKGDIYHMSEAISSDSLTPAATEGLGLSQTLRLKSFINLMRGERPAQLPEEVYTSDLNGFPTVGAEFHFPPNTPDNKPTFWERIALLNMSQYQRGCYVQLSRDDRNVIEVRMNPSIYPITTANWQHMRLLLPELNNAYFTITINRSEHNNFYWDKSNNDLLNKLRGIGLLIYSGNFDNIPKAHKREEINFGAVYLGQTVRLSEDVYSYEGNWGGGDGQYGQMGIYTGYGDNLPELSYYLSMILVEPNLLRSLPHQEIEKIKNLKDALRINSPARKDLFDRIVTRIGYDNRLSKADKKGKDIMAALF